MITAQQSSKKIIEYVKTVDVIPVLVVDEPAVAVDLAKVLVDVGLPVLEVTLRTPKALQVIEKMATVDGAIIAAGTVLNPSHVIDARSAGADFIVSPGYTDVLSLSALQADMPLLPGAATATEIMQMTALGFSMLKFFPAETNGGVPALKSFSGPLPDVSFCPTGGVNRQNLKEYLALANVRCVGGSWLVNQRDLQRRDWESIRRKVQAMSR